MTRHWLFPPRRAVEATSRELVATGAAGGGNDGIDNDGGNWHAVGAGQFEMPTWTTRRARASSLAAYRANPMARAIIDTYTSFGVGDSGVSLLCSDAQVRTYIDRWWADPKNQLWQQALMMRDWMLNGEAVYEYMTAPLSGFVRWSPIHPDRVSEVLLQDGNPLWHQAVKVTVGVGQTVTLPIAQVSDLSQLREGAVGYFPSWRATLFDRRGVPFLTPVLDDLDAYGLVLGNLVDRTALARYLVFDVTVTGGKTAVDDFIAARGGKHAPPSGSVEVHNEGVKWDVVTAETGSFEDTNTMGGILTNVAGGAGLAKTWLAEADGANRATSLSMAEPVRRRVGGVQAEWLSIQTEFARFAVDRAVAAGRLPRLVPSTNVAGERVMIPAADTVKVTGPEIAAADSQVTAAVFLNLSQALDGMVSAGVLTKAAAAIAAQKAWEQFVGQPFRPDLAAKLTDDPTDNTTADDLAQEAERAARLRLA